MPAPRYRLASPPPERALVLFDGDCRFCQHWAGRWRTAYAGRLDVAASQTERGRFPEIPPAAFNEALQLIEPDGAVYSGAYAALRARAIGSGRRGLLLPMYESVPGVAGLTEFGYRIVARNRRVFSMLMR
jgi:predicted DCC family thiol-disulfide oxidoreductase YuxK